MKPVKRFAILLLVINMLLLNGCWNYREVDSMSMVAAMAIDKGVKGFKYHTTFEFLDLSSGKSGSKLLETDGDTVFDCARNAIGKSEKKLFFSDCKVIILSKDIASEGIAPLVDWLIRDAEPRINLNLFISKEKTAAVILEQKPITDQLIGLEIWRMEIQNSVSLCESPDVKLYQATNILAGEGSSLILPTIKITKGAETTLELDGTAVFKKDKLVGYLNRNESKFLLYTNDKIHGGLLVTSPKDDGNNITLEIVDNQTKVTPVMKDNELTMNIEIKMKANLAEDQTSQGYVSESGLKEAEKSAKKTLSYGVNNVIKETQSQYGSDIFGFGSKISQDHPDWWKKVKSSWDQSFQKLSFSITPDVTIVNTATAKAKVKVGD